MIRIKKYANRRLYNTASSSYVNLGELADLVRSGHRIQVVDAKSEEDLTQSVLLQILMEEQGGGNLLPSGLLHRIIRSTVDHPMQKLAMGQLAAGLQLLDQQLEAFEVHAAPPPPVPRPAPTPEPAPEPEPTAPQQDAEMDALRARLAALETRLSEV